MYGGGGGGGGQYSGGGGGQYGGGGGGGHYEGGGADNSSTLFSGGGFMPSQATNTPEGSSSFPRTRNAQTLLPVTVKQLMDACQINDDRSSFAVNGTELSTVRLVGRMLNKTERVTDVSFILDDCTGRIDVNRWENETSDTNEMNEVKNGDYVIVNGCLKGFQGKRHVNAYSVRLVTNYNDITHHFLYCIYVHLDLSKSKRQLNAKTGTLNQAPVPNNQAPTSSASGNSTGTELSKLVMSVFHDPVLINVEHGVSVQQVADRLKLSEELARSTVQELVDLGNLYSTIDDNHYKSTLNG
ncbi:replication protein A 32 kDa subunit B [Brachypodium distachyon]|uniref:Replication protein A C-terminal domain-containing protein n=1 Tax=Brachypodium distachyon TaxID=15368 RepID=I1IBU9_BRADI|nr:replication protein A 32 kDa subunit B [Brachypodium distachyon]KQK00456.1 hypothetical protein BRADI_3g49530v3 [Brachypodium distachyon]|eukprot:XP_003575423.1 replication protein A 32 kDa subunit B [Brachypodium distachyon]